MQAGCALVGGETAEMPGMYQGDDYDLAGFCVGLVEKDAIIDGRSTHAGDAIIGLASSGPHSNGYSLIRKLLTDSASGPGTMLGGRALHDLLLEPTRIYVRAVLALLREIPVHGIAHITGGGLSGNIPRTLPSGVEAVIDARALATAGGVRLAAEDRRHRRCGDVPHLQLRSRDDPVRRVGRRRPGACDPCGTGRSGNADRRDRERRPGRRNHRMTRSSPLVVLVSGRGSNLRAIEARMRPANCPHGSVPC